MTVAATLLVAAGCSGPTATDPVTPPPDTPLNQPPSLRFVPDQRTTSGDGVTVVLTLDDEAADDVIVAATADDATLVPEGGVTLSGTGATRTMRIRPSTTGIGATTVTVVATDAEGATDSLGFELVVDPPFEATPVEIAEALDGDAHFGGSVAVDGDHVVVGAPDENQDTTDDGAAYVFRRNGTAWTPVATLTAPDPVASARFGVSVAISGDTIVVGAPGESGQAGEPGTGEGAVYAFRFDGDAWTFEARLVGDDAVDGDAFGSAVAIDGGVVVVGAPGTDEPRGALLDAGAAYLFERIGDAWTEVERSTSPFAETTGDFGAAVAIAAGTVAIGEPGADDGGRVHVYVVGSSGWTYGESLAPSSESGSTAEFGTSVATDGKRILVGAPNASVATFASGAAELFVVGPGGTWSPEGRLVATGDDVDPLFGEFGFAVAIRGRYAVVGAPRAGASADHGAAYVFRDDDGTWTHRMTFTDTAAADLVGWSVALDGDHLAFGAPYADGALTDQGAATVVPR